MPVPRPGGTASRSPYVWKSGAIDSMMPQKTHVAPGLRVGFQERVAWPSARGRNPGSRIGPRSAEVFPISHSCQVFEPRKTPQSPVPEGFKELRVDILSTRFAEDPKFSCSRWGWRPKNSGTGVSACRRCASFLARATFKYGGLPHRPSARGCATRCSLGLILPSI